MSRIDEARYGRMCQLVINVCPFTLRHVIDDYALRHAGSLSLCDFLEKNKHSLFHLCAKTCCCGHQYRSKSMIRLQWDKLFMQNTLSCLNGKWVDCPCKYDSKPGVTTKVMDVTMCCLVINNLCPGVDAIHIQTIREIRNNLIHAESARLDLLTYNGYFNRIKTAICQLAKNVSTTLHTDTLKMIAELENRLMDPVELSELRNLIIDEKRFTDLEMDTSSIAEDLVQTREEMFEIKEKLMRTVHEHNQRQDDISRLAAAFADQEQTIAKQQEKLDSLQLEKSDTEMKTNEMKKFLRDGVISIQHARGIIVGCAGAGKTSLLKRLQGKSIQEIEEIDSTRGLEAHYHFDIKDGRLEVCEHEIEKTSFLSVAASELKSESDKRNPSKQSDHVLPDRSIPEIEIELVAEFESKSALESVFESFFGKKTTTKKEAENTSQDQSASGISDDQIRKILLEKEKSFKITMVDIAGQLAYYACHQTYFTDKGFYVLVLDMTKTFDTPVEQEGKSGRDSIFAKWTYKEYLRFWIDSIKTFGNKRAPVFLVATHCEGKKKNEINRYFEEVFDLVEEDRKWLKRIVGGRKFAFALKDFSYDSKKKLDEMKQMMVDVATKELDSSLKVRASWALVEDFLRNSNKKMISRSEIWQMKENIGSKYHFADEDEMETFLSFFHDHGFLLYFNEKHLKEYVVLDIQWFVNAFSIIIADKTHFESDNADNKIKKWEQFDKTGMLTNDLLKTLWENDEILLEHQDAILSYMERLRMITVVDGDWYVPCMNKKHDTSNELESYTISCSVLSRKYAIFLYFRLIAYCISVFRWSVLLDKNSLKQLYQTATCFADNNCCFAIRISNENINVNFKQAESDHTKEKFLSAIKDALTEITETFFPHGSDEETENKCFSMEEKANTSFHFETKGKLDVKGDEEEQSSSHGLQRKIQEQSDLHEFSELLLDAKREYVGTELLLCRDSEGNAVIIGYNSTMSLSKIEIPGKYRGKLRIKNPRNVSDEAFKASTYGLENKIRLNDWEEDILQSCIARHSSRLWGEHSNLTMISGDCVKYTAGLPEVKFCVVLYCLSKGYIPFDERPFPRVLNEKGHDIEVDVREGYFLFGPTDLIGRMNHWNDPVCMGSSIGNKKDKKNGSVGFFVNLPNNGIGFITCCHVLFDCIHSRGMDNYYRAPDRTRPDHDAFFIVQPSLNSVDCGIDKDQRICGFVERAVFKPECDPVSVDAALIRMTDRKPGTGHFTISVDTQISEAGYDEKKPPLYNGGKILCKITSNEREKPLIKSGTTTGLTKGEFKMNGLEISIPEDGAFLGDSALYYPKRAMKGQYEVRSSMTFFDLGDSGSAVFLKDPDGSLKCVGMAIGRTSFYTTVVTPIGAILQALGLQEQDMTNFGEPMNLG